MIKNLPALQETQVQSLGQEDPLEKGMAIHSSIIDWRILMDRGSWWAKVHGGSEKSDAKQVKKQQSEPNMEQQTGSKLGKDYVKAVYCHPAYLTYMQSTSYKMPSWMDHKLESRLLEEISTTSDMQMIPL